MGGVAKKKAAFTIIEVVLVLAIGGLVFLMVFVALPNMQRSQRNAQRKRDLGRFVSAVVEYQSNNNGRTPMEAIRRVDEEKRTEITYNFLKTYIMGDANSGYRIEIDEDAGRADVVGCNDAFRDPSGSCYVLMDFSNIASIEKKKEGGVHLAAQLANDSSATDEVEDMLNKYYGGKVPPGYLLFVGHAKCPSEEFNWLDSSQENKELMKTMIAAGSRDFAIFMSMEGGRGLQGTYFACAGVWGENGEEKPPNLK